MTNTEMNALVICNGCEAEDMAPGQEAPGQPGYCAECLAEARPVATIGHGWADMATEHVVAQLALSMWDEDEDNLLAVAGRQFAKAGHWTAADRQAATDHWVKIAAEHRDEIVALGDAMEKLLAEKAVTMLAAASLNTEEVK